MKTKEYTVYTCAQCQQIVDNGGCDNIKDSEYFIRITNGLLGLGNEEEIELRGRINEQEFCSLLCFCLWVNIKTEGKVDIFKEIEKLKEEEQPEKKINPDRVMQIMGKPFEVGDFIYFKTLDKWDTEKAKEKTAKDCAGKLQEVTASFLDSFTMFGVHHFCYGEIEEHYKPDELEIFQEHMGMSRLIESGDFVRRRGNKNFEKVKGVKNSFFGIEGREERYNFNDVCEYIQIKKEDESLTLKVGEMRFDASGLVNLMDEQVKKGKIEITGRSINITLNPSIEWLQENLKVGDEILFKTPEEVYNKEIDDITIQEHKSIPPRGEKYTIANIIWSEHSFQLPAMNAFWGFKTIKEVIKKQSQETITKYSIDNIKPGDVVKFKELPDGEYKETLIEHKKGLVDAYGKNHEILYALPGCFKIVGPLSESTWDYGVIEKIIVKGIKKPAQQHFIDPSIEWLKENLKEGHWVKFKERCYITDQWVLIIQDPSNWDMYIIKEVFTGTEKPTDQDNENE